MPIFVPTAAGRTAPTVPNAPGVCYNAIAAGAVDPPGPKQEASP